MAQRRIVIVGGGIVGCLCSLRLQTLGWKVILIESSSDLLQGISAAGFGSLTPFSDPFFADEARTFAAEGVEIYRRSLLPHLALTTGIATHMESSGLLQLCRTTKEVSSVQRQIGTLVAAGHTAKFIPPLEVSRLEPNLCRNIAGAALLDEPWLDTTNLFASINAAIHQKQIETRTNTEVIGIREHGGLSVKMNNGCSIGADFALISTGLSLKPIEGIPTYPLRYVRGDAIQVRCPYDTPLLKRHIYFRKGFITPRRDGKILLGATYIEDSHERVSGMRSDVVEVKQAMALLKSNSDIMPKLGDTVIEKLWRNWRPTPADDLPILGALQERSRILVATGFIGLGITMAPAVAEAVGGYLQHGIPDAFPSSFNPNRFTNS